MILYRLALAGLAALVLSACAQPPAARVDETRAVRPVIDPKAELERGPRR